MAARAKFDSDAPYLTHPRAAAIHYEPLPTAVLRQLARLERLLRRAPSADEAEWLNQQAALVLAEWVTPPPAPVRGLTTERRDRRPRHEIRYGRRGFGPRNKSGKARS